MQNDPHIRLPDSWEAVDLECPGPARDGFPVFPRPPVETPGVSWSTLLAYGPTLEAFITQAMAFKTLAVGASGNFGPVTAHLPDKHEYEIRFLVTRKQ